MVNFSSAYAKDETTKSVAKKSSAFLNMIHLLFLIKLTFVDFLNQKRRYVSPLTEQNNVLLGVRPAHFEGMLHGKHILKLW